MGDFSPDWLALREPADARARSAALVHRLADWLGQASHPARAPGSPLAVLDLGCGTGANLRALAPRLAAAGHGRQSWLCVDRDPALLAALGRAVAAWAGRNGLGPATEGGGLRIGGPGIAWQIATQALDLGQWTAALPIGPGTLVVASALLDLVSEAWLDGLLRTCAAVQAPLLLTLTYDGRVLLAPPLPLDDEAIGLVNVHQRRDKGMGPALGPDAPARLAHLAASRGLCAALADSAWHLGPDRGRLQAALVDGWAAAAREQSEGLGGPAADRWRVALEEWRATRRALIEAGRSRMQVGHRDALLLPRFPSRAGASMLTPT
jgi:SAM-dependent methyltransferase